MEGRIEVTIRQGRGHKQLLDDLKETTDYLKLKEEHWLVFCAELAVEDVMELS